MRRKFLLAIIAISAAMGAQARAADDSARILSLLQARYPEGGIKAVAPSASLKGWYEVMTDNEIAYTTPGADLLLAGHLIDTATKRDLTAARLAELQKIDFASLPEGLAIKTVRGNGRNMLAVFADPLCPYCQQLEQSLAKIEDVTIYTYLYPLEELHPGATAQSAKIWCSDDRAAAWQSWMSKHENVAAAGTCDTGAINAVADLGRKLRINSTPTLIYPDGRRISGNQSVEAIRRELAASSAR